MFYLTITTKRKNAKRHVVNKFKNLEDAKKLSNNINECYIVEIYTGRWEFVERIK